MILRLTSCLLLLIAAVPASGQVPKCDGDVLLVTHEHMGKLTQSEIGSAPLAWVLMPEAL
jgi:hypothetical protein